MATQRNHYSAEFKAKVALEALKEQWDQLALALSVIERWIPTVQASRSVERSR